MSAPRALFAAIFSALLSSATGAQAEIRLSLRPVFGDGCLSRSSPTELIATVDNTLAVALVGTLVLDHSMGTAHRVRTLRSVQVSVAPRAIAEVHISTADIVPGNDLVAQLQDPRGRLMASAELASMRSASAMLVDATRGSRFALSMRASAPPEGLGPASPTSPAVLTGCAVARDTASGDPVMPWSVQGYAEVSLVLVDTSTLTAMGTRERLVLADYILRGGSLAVVVDTPEDLGHPVLSALVGSEVSVSPFLQITPQAPSINPWYNPPSGNGVRTAPQAPTLAHASQYTGGNLHQRSLVNIYPGGSAQSLGSSAEYGHGQVHLLSFNPARAPALDDPWTSAVLQQLAAHANELTRRRLLSAVRDSASVPSPVRALLSAPDTQRAGLGRALGVLVLYSFVLPLCVALARALTRRRFGLLAVPLVALMAFVTLGLLGSRHRETLSRARSVALVDLAAGFPRGIVRRFHGYVPQRDGPLACRIEAGDRALVVDPDAGHGAVRAVEAPSSSSLVGLRALAWSPVIVRDEGTETLSGNVSLVTDSLQGLRVINRLREALEDAVLLAPEGDLGWYFRWIPPGAQRRAVWGRALPEEVVRAMRQNALSEGLPLWDSEAARRMAAEINAPASEASRALSADGIPRALGLGAARWGSWRAAQSIAEMSETHGWQVATEPVLIARIVRRAHGTDNGMRVDRDDTWLRVRGFGGAP